ncbi:MAG: hypothetical protein HY242_09585 [Afipia sp.]|nr:hypothetical protein [Afipia sp.]
MLLVCGVHPSLPDAARWFAAHPWRGTLAIFNRRVKGLSGTDIMPPRRPALRYENQGKPSYIAARRIFDRRNCDVFERFCLGTLSMNRNALYALVGALVVAFAVLGYKVYKDNQEPQGLQINFGPGGVKIQNK